MDGSQGPAADKVLSFCSKLKNRIDIPVLTFDERLTTKQGEAIMIAADLSRQKRKKRIDTLAAQIILQAYLDFRKQKES